MEGAIEKDVYPLPPVEDAVGCLPSVSYFSSVDLRPVYWQFALNPSDKEKTAFVTPDGMYEYSVMPFGMCNAPATFERFMDTVLSSLTWHICMCRLDDVVIFLSTSLSDRRRSAGSLPFTALLS